ncbi:MAG: hypothetical protein V1904_13580 [Bacteroidota bacterium]
MKTLLTFVFLFAFFLFISCGTVDTNDKVKKSQDSARIADSLSKIITEVESWDLLQLAMTNEAGFKNKYGNKKLKIKNLVVDNITKKGTIECLAYSPADSILSNTSQKGDVTKKVTEHRDYVNDIPCKINPDFTYYFDVALAETTDTSGIKTKKMKEEKLSRKSYFFSILTIECESISFKEDVFSLKNCKVIRQ